MKTAQTVEELDRLVDDGERLLEHAGSPWGEGGHLSEISRWRTLSREILISVFGAEHRFTDAFGKSVTFVNGFFPDAQDIQVATGVLRASRDFVAGGYFDLRRLIAAEVFTSLLDEAEHLLDVGYKDPAAVLTGSVLEDGLRRIADKRGLTLNPKSGMSAINDALRGAGVYTPLLHRQVQVWIEIRNNAAHGKIAEYEAADVRAMHVGVSQLLDTHL